MRCAANGCGQLLLRDGTCLTHGEPKTVATAEPIEVGEADDPWTDEDIAFVRANLGRMTSRELGAALGRSPKAVKNKCERLGISIPRITGRPRPARKRIARGSRRGAPWTEEEILALEAADVKLLAMSRSFSAVKAKACRIGAPVRSGDGFLSIRQVSGQYGVHRVRTREWIDRGLLPAKRSGRMWRIDPAVAERVIPILKKATRANHGRNGWWAK